MTGLAPLLTVAAVALTVAWTARAAAAGGMDGGEAYRAAVLAAVGGWVGGALLYGATHGVWDGRGQSAFGVLAGAALVGATYLRLRHRPLLPFADAAAPGLALGYAVARLGCFLNGDDFGVTTPALWGVAYVPGTEAWAAHVARGWIPADGVASLPVVPVQLLLGAAALAIFGGLLALTSRARRRPGLAAGSAAAAYGLARFAIEPLRDDFAAVAGPLSLPQLLALSLLAGGLLASGLALRPAPGRCGAPPSAAPSRRGVAWR